MRTWQIGSFKVTEVPEMPIAVGLMDGLIAEATPEAVKAVDWMYPDFANGEGKTLWDIHTYVVDTGDKVILVDPGCGNGKTYPLQPSWTGLDTPFLERLMEAGYKPDDVDIILCTHVHLDHIGWVAVRDDSGEWVPTFPNARLMLGQVDYDYYLELRDAPEDERPNGFVYPDPDCDPSLPRQMKLVWEETLRPVVEAGLLDLLPTGSQIVEGVSYVSTPGHTRGHQSVTLDSEGHRAFITGDFIHHPMQIAHPDWSSGGDWDADASAKNRRDFFESCAGTDLLILGSHFTGMGAGYIVEDGDGFRLVATAPTA